MALTIVMYHYVRDLAGSRFPEIKALERSNFRGQLDYLQQHYVVMSATEVAAALREERAIPSNACVLTFDDGYSDHYFNVYPELRARNLVGCFYPPACLLNGEKVLQVNKVQFVLASTSDHVAIKQAVLRDLVTYRSEWELPSDEELYAQYAPMSRWDDPDTTFIKRVLQKGLPQEVSSQIADKLFRDFVDVEEGEFAAELYMNLEQMKEMVANGMEIGGHSSSHQPLANLSRKQQAQELEQMVGFLDAVYGDLPDVWTMSYPSGSYNADTLDLLGEVSCGLAMTTNVGLAEVSQPLELKRLNTNDFPFSGNADINSWTMQVLEAS